MDTDARGVVGGGFTVYAEASQTTKTRITACAVRASSKLASAKRKQLAADGGDESAERGRDAPPAYAELSAHFGVLESAAEKSGNADAAHYLSKARMAMILAHAARHTRQADMREFIATE